MRRPVTTALLCCTLLLLSGCKGACRELSEKLCECSSTSSAREACKQRVANDQAFFEPTAEQEAVCEQRLEGCDCHSLDTDEGKQACGLAR